MNRGIKWILIGLGAVVLFIVGAVLIITLVVDVNQYKPVIEQKVAQQTGRTFTIGGQLDFSLIPTTAISFSDLKLGNPEGFEEDTFVSIDAFEARIKFWPFLLSGFKDIQVERFLLKKPRFALVRHKSGRTNWEGIGQTASQAPSASQSSQTEEKPAGGSPAALPFAIAVNEFAITDATLIWDDQAGAQRYEVTDLDLLLEDVSLDRPIGIEFSASIDQKTVTLSGNVGPVGQSPGKQPVALDLTMTALKEVSLKLTGQLDRLMETPRYDLNIQLDPFSPRKAAQALGRPLPIPPSDSDTLTRASVKAQLSGTPETFSLSDGHLVLDDTNVLFSAASKNIKQPDLSFDIDIDRINLDRYLPPPSDQKPSSDQKPGQKPGEETPKTGEDPLKQMRLDGKIKMDQMTVKGIKTQDVRVHVTADKGVIRVDPAALSLYGGSVTSRGRFDLAAAQPKIRLRLNTSDIGLSPLMRDLKQKELIEGTLNGELSMQFAGDDPAAVKKSLTGNGKFRIDNGALKGVDLVAMVRNEDGAYGLTSLASGAAKTDFTQIQMPFTIVRGVFKTIDTRLFSELLRVSIKGTANLVEETLDFRIEPTAVTTGSKKARKIKRSEVTVPVIVSGTFDDPKYRPDLSRAAQKAIEKEVFESKEAEKLLEKNPELKQLEEPAKKLLEGILNN